MDRFEAWFDGQDAFAPAATPSRPNITLPKPGTTLLRMAALFSAVLLATSLVGGAHRVGLLTTSGTTGVAEPSPDTTTTGSGDPIPTPSVSAPPQAAVAGLLPISECKLGPTGSKWYFSAGFPIDDYSDVLTTGSLRIAVIYVEFPDAARRSPVSELHKKIEDHVSQIYSEMSYGKLSIDLIPSSDWIMMDKSSARYNILQQEADNASVVDYVSEAVTKADPGIDFSGIDVVAVFATELADGVAGDFQLTLPDRIPTDEGSGVFSTIVTGGDWWQELVDPMILAHEIGHVVGLQDLYNGDSEDTFEDGNKFVGNFDFMSHGYSNSYAPTLLGWDRWRLGWIPDSQVVCAQPSEGTEVNVNALQSGTGTTLIVLPLSETRAIVIESRRPIGWDRQLVESGALVYLVDTAVDTSEGPIQILADMFGDGFSAAPLSAGEYVDALSYTITSLEVAAWGDRIYITP
jgi:M6 family metalloprotease-like protein